MSDSNPGFACDECKPMMFAQSGKQMSRTGPEKYRADRKRSEYQKGRTISNPLGKPTAERRAQRCANSLSGQYASLTHIDAARTIEYARDKTWDGNALQSCSDTVEDLNREDAPSFDEIGGDESANG